MRALSFPARSSKAYGRSSLIVRCAAWVWLATLAAPARADSEDVGEDVVLSDRTSLRERIGVEALLGSPEHTKEQTIRRLGALGTEAALQELTPMADDTSSLDDRELVTLTRALARSAHHVIAQRGLYAILTRAFVPVDGQRGGTPLARLARQQAAIALAASGSGESLSLLAKMLKRGGADAELASMALLAHPPDKLQPLLDTPGLPSVALVSFLEELGDQRAFHFLRSVVRRGQTEAQARAALALTRLGHLETVPLAHHWLKHPVARELRDAATEILLQVRDPAAPLAFRSLYERDAEKAVQLAIAYPDAALVPELIRAWKEAEPPQLALLTALGVTQEPDAAKVLSELVASAPESFDGDFLPAMAAASAAADALARSPGSPASEALSTLLEQSEGLVRRLAAMAAVIRVRTLGEAPTGLERSLEQLRHGTVMDKWVGVWGSSALHEEYATSLLGARSPFVLSAVTATAPLHSKDFFVAAAAALQAESDVAKVRWLGVALLHPKGRDRVPSDRLLEWVEPGGAWASLAVLALSERDDPRHQGRLEMWLGSPDPWIRAAALLGLGRHRDPAHTATLASAYQYEVDPDVRLAALTALSHRAAAPVREETLELAEQLDPDPRLRAAARLVRHGHRLRIEPTGSEAVWVEIPSGRVPDVLIAAHRVGVAWPVPSHGQRVVPILGLGEGSVRLRVATQPRERNDGDREQRDAQ